MAEMDIPGNDLSLSRSARQQTLLRKRDLPLGDSTPTEDLSLSDKSLISLLDGKTYLGAPNLPLTPPSLPADSTISQEARQPASPRIPDERVEGATDATPALQIDTVTPNVTPSRAVALLRKQEAQNPIYLSMSSREESFTTAKEAQSSDEEKEKITSLTTLRVPKQRSPHSRTNSLSDGGKGSTSGSGHSTPKKRTTGGGKPLEFPSFDTQRDASWENSGRGLGKRAKDTSQEEKHRGDSDKPPTSSVHRGRGVHNEIEDTQETDNDPIIVKFAKDIGWLGPQEQHGGNAETQNRRFSVTSVNSTITIEAIVIDVPQQRRRTLRHIRKNESLRSSSLPVRRPRNRDPALLDSTEPQRRLSHKSARLSNQDRGSVASDTSLDPSAVSHRRKPKEEVIPVVVIPQRRSSLKGSARSSRNHSLARSTKSARRPTTAPNGGTASFDVVQRPRAMSESLPTRPKDLRTAFRKSGITAPRIPVRRSSLSAPTNRSNSRAASLTSNTLPFQPLPYETPFPITRPESQSGPVPPVVTVSTNGAPEGLPSASQVVEQPTHTPYVDDNAGQHSPLLPPLTPFQPSIQSLSPGPIEISEAKAVPFFAHNNESILIVEPSQPTSSRTHQSIRSQAPLRLDTDETVTPPAEMANTNVDSPLRNPRPPPKPPVSNSTGPSIAPVGPGKAHGTGTIGRRFGSLRRAISLKRRSELSPSITTHRVRNPKAGKDIDDSQQAFWRPRPFWDDIKDSEMDQCTGSRPQQPATNDQQDAKNDNTYVRNSLGIPQSKAILQAPISLIRRVSNRARVRNARPMNVSHVSLASSALSRRSRRNRHYVVPRLGVRLPRHPLKDMRDWMTRTRRQREEEKLEARRDELRKKIGVIVPVEDDNRHVGAV